jgi:lysozyme
MWSAYRRLSKLICIPQLNILTATPEKKEKRMETSKEGIALIKKFEGCELSSYICSGGVQTIGYGHTKDVKEGDTCTPEEAEEFLKDDLESFEGAVSRLVEVDLTQNQFDALVSWTFNLGWGALSSSTLLKVLNDGNYKGVPEQIKRWNMAGGKVLDGLVRRREAEALLFEGKPWEDV